MNDANSESSEANHSGDGVTGQEPDHPPNCEASLKYPVSITGAISLVEIFDDALPTPGRVNRFNMVEISSDNTSWWIAAEPDIGGGPLDLLQRFGAWFSREQWIKEANDFLGRLSVEDRQHYLIGQTEGLFQDSGFPADALPQPIREMSDELASIHGVPVELIAAYALAVTGAAVGKGIALKTWRGLSVYGNIYVLVALESGFGKSVVTKPLLAPFIAFERQLQSEHASQLPRIDAELAMIQQQIACLLRNKRAN